MRGLSAKRTVEALCAEIGVTVDGPNPYDIHVKNPRFYRRVIRQQSIGLGEAYMDGWWECARLDLLFERIYGNGLSREKNGLKRGLGLALAQLTNRQTPLKSRKVNDTHYDLGNDLFEKMLGPSMVYTCGHWDYAADLEKAQLHKNDMACRKLNLKPGQTVLDIGCGYGTLLAHAVRNYGVKGVGVTLSKRHCEYARERCRGLPVEIRLQDYRSVTGSYDRVFSVGMFEAVGHKNYRHFMKKVAELLLPEGALLLHTVGTYETKFPTRHWVDKYIFPNGYMPSLSQITRAADGVLRCNDLHDLGLSYAKTLLAWHQNFVREWPDLEARYGERFRRMWEFYLLSFAGGFRAQNWQLWQIVLSKRGAALGDLNQARIFS